MARPHSPSADDRDGVRAGVARRSSRRALGAWICSGACACGGPTSGPSPAAYEPAANDHGGAGADAGAASVVSSSGGVVSTGSGAPSGGAPSGDDTSAGDAADSNAADSNAAAGDAAGGDAEDQPFASPDAASNDTDGSAPCVTGQVTPDEVVMLGDSYLDPAWGNVGPTVMMLANASYRHYYIGGASLAWGNPDTQFYIPYQYDPMALTDTTVTNPADIKVIIMDGGGNDVLIGNTSCETTAPPTNTSCVMTVQNAVDQAQTTMKEMAQKGVQSVVFFFYPHLSTAGGGILLTPAPAVNDTLDYAYPLAEQMCCGSPFASSLTDYSCSGQPIPGLTCVFIDTRPSFEGHLSDYIKSDNVHPTQAGANVIANLIWTQMQNHCIAQ
jgi:lysophospholipase L1-like esterase